MGGIVLRISCTDGGAGIFNGAYGSIKTEIKC